MSIRNIKHRKSIRLKDFDYSQAGAYFVTICTQERKCLFGDGLTEKMALSEIGEKVRQFWLEIPQHFQHVDLDTFVVMPNHLHGILNILDVGVQHVEPLPQKHQYQKIIPKSLGSIIRSYKATVTRWCGQNGCASFKWQRNFYERVIRNQSELSRIREYIVNNPLKWHLDKENPQNWKHLSMTTPGIRKTL